MTKIYRRAVERLAATCSAVAADARLGARRIRLSPGFSVLFVVVLASACGTTAAIQAVIDSVFHRPLGIAAPDSVMNVYGSPLSQSNSSRHWQVSLSDYRAILQQQSTFADLLAWRRIRTTFVDGVDPSPSFGEAVSLNYFDVLGVKALVGRTFRPEDRGASRAIVLSYSTWAVQFSGDPAIIGRVVRLNSGSFEVIGVAQPSFRGADMPAVHSTSAWIPMSVDERTVQLDANSTRADDDSPSVFVKGRLKPGVSKAQAVSDLMGLGVRLDVSNPHRATNQRDLTDARAFTVFPAADVVLHESVHSYASDSIILIRWTLALAMIVACTNLAGLQTGRLATRSADLAIRSALGATRWRMLSALSAEVAILVALSVTLGMVVAIQLCAGMSTTLDSGEGIVFGVTPSIDRWTIVSLIIFGGMALVIAGGLPALRAIRSRGPSHGLANDSQPITRWRGRRVLIGAQVGVTVLMLALACLFGRKAIGVLQSDFGVDYGRIVATRLTSSPDNDASWRARVTDIVRAVQQSPGVKAAAIVSGIPIGYSLKVGDVTNSHSASAVSVHPAVLYGTGAVAESLGLRLISGAFVSPNTTGALVTPRLASKLFGSDVVVGRTIEVHDSDQSSVGEITVIGVVAEIVGGPAASQGSGTIIILTPNPVEAERVVIGHMQHETTSAAWLTELIHRIDPRIEVAEPRSGRTLLRSVTALPAFGATLTIILATLSALLSAAGLVGVLGHLVASRNREIGVRMALGANRRTLVWKIIADGMTPVITGLCIGGTLSFVAVAALGAASPRIGSLPSWSYVAISLGVIVAALGACAGPAHRAASIEPSVALRDS